MDKSNSVFNKTNFLLVGIGTVLVILGFCLMAGPSTTLDHFEPDIFSVRRIRIAPVISLIGFIVMLVGVIYKKSNKS